MTELEVLGQEPEGNVSTLPAPVSLQASVSPFIKQGTNNSS